MKIAVIGAGIGGLTFAAAMRRFCPDADVEVYERDQGPESRSQGNSLGLNGDKALAVLKMLDLYERVAGGLVTVTRFVFCDQRGHPLLELPATGDEKRLTLQAPACMQGYLTSPMLCMPPRKMSSKPSPRLSSYGAFSVRRAPGIRPLQRSLPPSTRRLSS
jgi:hypothetical protein